MNSRYLHDDMWFWALTCHHFTIQQAHFMSIWSSMSRLWMTWMLGYCLRLSYVVVASPSEPSRVSLFPVVPVDLDLRTPFYIILYTPQAQSSRVFVVDCGNELPCKPFIAYSYEFVYTAVLLLLEPSSSSIPQRLLYMPKFFHVQSFRCPRLNFCTYPRVGAGTGIEKGHRAFPCHP